MDEVQAKMEEMQSYIDEEESIIAMVDYLCKDEKNHYFNEFAEDSWDYDDLSTWNWEHEHIFVHVRNLGKDRFSDIC